MASKRKYPYTLCANPACESPYFQPHDKRQRFCTPHCNDNYHNDKRSLKEKSLKAYLKEQDIADQKLEVAYQHMGYNVEPIDELMLQLLGIDLNLATKEKSNKSGKEVLWFMRYGLQKLDTKDPLYKILCRNNL